MSKLLVFGHLNPDTDTICSSIVAADLINKLDLGYEAEPVRLGKVNKETEYVFNYLNMEAQREISSVGEDDLLWLVDHNEAGQSVEGREKATVVGVIDHHRIKEYPPEIHLPHGFREILRRKTVLSYQRKGIGGDIRLGLEHIDHHKKEG